MSAKPTKAGEPNGCIYVFWAEGTTRFKVGYTARGVGLRGREVQANSPMPLRVVGDFPGSMRDEARLHGTLRAYRLHGEWFDLPEDAVWWLLRDQRPDMVAQP